MKVSVVPRIAMSDPSQELTTVVDVGIEARSGGGGAVYTYAASPGVARGDAVIVPLGTRQALGFVVGIRSVTPDGLGFPVERLRRVNRRIEGFSLPEPLVDLVQHVSNETLCPLSVALNPASPPGAKDRLVANWRRNLDMPGSPSGAVAQEVLLAIDEAGGVLAETRVKKLSPAIKRTLRTLVKDGWANEELALEPISERRAPATLRIAADDDQVERFLKDEGRKKPAQALVLMTLQTTERLAFSSSEIRAMCGVTETTVKALLTAGLLEPVPASVGPVEAPEPNAHQRLAIDAVAEAIVQRRAQGFLLYGITGSGKTEVYLRLAAEALRLGRQVLYLVPEIALAPQAIGRLRERFGPRVAVVHSELSPTERLQSFHRIRSGQTPIVVGARSAVFSPLDNVGLIVVDEEHESGYKQESAPRYHAKRLAAFLASRHASPYVLGSATPSVESFFEAETEQLTLLSLPKRAGKAVLPTVSIVDLGEGYRKGKPTILSSTLSIKMAECLDAGLQTILFLNRRAYSPFLLCRDCGYHPRCPQCEVSLSFHRRDLVLRCHHCGHQTGPPDACPKCGGTRVNAFGVGVERVEEAVQESFPQARVGRLDRDSTRKTGALEETLAKFRAGELNVLVGTQMVAKGLDFPRVTLVGVIAADVSLNLPDFRATERTFQLLSQVAGRSGRGKWEGQVVIQTFCPDTPAVICAQAHDYLTMYESLKDERKEALYPPFRRLVNVVLSGPSKPAVVSAGAEAARLAWEHAPAAEVLGPVDCALERLQGRWRRHLLLKLPPNSSVTAVGEALCAFQPPDVTVVVDVDPYSMM